jgi:hypothetical protein
MTAEINWSACSPISIAAVQAPGARTNERKRVLAVVIAVYSAPALAAQTAALPEPQVFAPGMISGPANDGAPTFSPDGTTLFFTRSNSNSNVWSISIAELLDKS